MPTDSERCPKCNRIENKKIVCAECGYEYNKDGSDVPVIISGFLVSFIFIWVISTLLAWAFGSDYKTLVGMLKEQWQWFKDLIGRIV
jgi:hypothetical protein